MLGIPLLPLVLILVGFLMAVALAAIFFIRRQVVGYRSPSRLSIDDPSFFSSAHALADPRPVRGNAIKILNNGDGIFPPMLEVIRSARQSINFEAFLFESSDIGTKFIEAFSERAQAGVKVRILLDGMGSGLKLDGKDVERLKKAGCSFVYYHPVVSWRIDQLNLRTHRRILVVDGRVAFTGGVGFSDEWRGQARSAEEWREIHFQLEGPVVACLQAAFQRHWFEITGETLSGENEFPELEVAGFVKMQVVETSAFAPGALSLVQAVAFASAKKTIYITNAYCAPTKDQTKLLIEAVKRGVDVRLLLPGKHNDEPKTKAAGRSAYGKLLKGGVLIYEYQPTMIHSKTAVVDGLFSIVGSSNFDNRSHRINEELDITVLDENFGNSLETIFWGDLRQAKPYTLDDFNNRSIKERFEEWLIRPFQSLL